MAGARGCFNCGGCAWCFCVVAVVMSPSRALCADACTYSSPFSFLPSFSCRRLWCGADGDRDFSFFYKLLYIGRAQSKLLSKIHVVCIVTRHARVKNTSWTPGCKLPKGGHTHLVKKTIHFCSDQMISCVNCSLVPSLVRPPLLAITVRFLLFFPP